MHHVAVAVNSSGRTDIERRLTGRFYTPLQVAERLAQDALASCPNPRTVADPFCGDGRLVLAWLKAAARTIPGKRELRRILLWDFDGAAVAAAREQVLALLAELGWKSCAVETDVGDTFELARSAFGTVDTLLTNPPWELLKPDSRDQLGSDGDHFKGHLRSYADRLARDFPGAMSAKGKAMTGYGVNLARAGATVSAMLTRADGVVAIVLPSAIFADQASAPFRRDFFDRLAVSKIDYYPAEARLFDGVDQPFVTVVGRAGAPSERFQLARFDKKLASLEVREVCVSGDRSRPIALTVGGAHDCLVRHLEEVHVTLLALEDNMSYGLWLGRELDETRLADFLTSADEGVPFLKGRHVFPYQIVREEEWWIDPRKRSIPTTVRESRLAWRDVSRPSQRRRMHVALVPDGHVTGNSLGVGFFRYGARERIRVLMGLMNSLVFELQVRTHLATAHVSQGVLRRCTVPMVCFESPPTRRRVLQLVEARVQRQAGELPELEVAVARAYGLKRDAFASVLEAFPKLTTPERDAHLKSELWS